MKELDLEHAVTVSNWAPWLSSLHCAETDDVTLFCVYTFKVKANSAIKHVKAAGDAGQEGKGILSLNRQVSCYIFDLSVLR